MTPRHPGPDPDVNRKYGLVVEVSTHSHFPNNVLDRHPTEPVRGMIGGRLRSGLRVTPDWVGDGGGLAGPWSMGHTLQFDDVQFFSHGWSTNLVFFGENHWMAMNSSDLSN